VSDSKESAPGLEIPWRAVIVAAIVCLAVALLYGRVDKHALQERATELNGTVCFALLTVLPLAGFPVSVLHVAAGIRFGVKLGLILVPVSILLQLLASYALVHVWHDAFERHLASVRKRIPPGAHGAVCLFTLLVPGVPYFAKNYVLPLIGVPLRTYLLWCLPMHAVRCVIPVMLGGESQQLTPARLIALGLYALALMGASWWTYRRLQSQLSSRRSAAGGRKRRA
jgi:uncharacterized membrane protein YdjX (TVP38/TMEM64 family)